MKTIQFVKMSGAGNDFVVIDNRRKGAVSNGPRAAQRLCDRRRSIGADGLLLVEKSRKADARMRIFNPDGSEAAMCGNGVRCVARFAAGPKRRLSIETAAGVIRAEVRGNTVKARIPDPRDLRLGVPLELNGSRGIVHTIDTGVPHAVVIVEDLCCADVSGIGRGIRRHDFFKPRGTNVNFVSIGPGNSIAVRTYERGVEGETAACGTGSTASALVSASLKNLKSPVAVRTAGGDRLKVYFKRTNGRFSDVRLEGPVETTFQGKVSLP